MKQVIASVAGVLMVAAVVIGQGKPGTEAPLFKVDPAWPKIPNNWQFGQVASVAIDAQDHVWVLQRPGTLSKEEKGRAAPPLLEFDEAGNFIQAWGGPGQGYEWPNSEHGVYIDPKGFVWIGGNGDKDHQILKFTKAGKFVMQIGRAGQSKGNADTQNLNQPADAFVYAKTNELIVADGYGNRRVIVFDADSGKFKRMWGAFGNVPTDAAPNPAPPDADAEGAPQFVQPVLACRMTAWFTSPTAAANAYRCSRLPGSMSVRYSSAVSAKRLSAATERRLRAPRSQRIRHSGFCMSAIGARHA